jgi:hypothetical protein
VRTVQKLADLSRGARRRRVRWGDVRLVSLADRRADFPLMKPDVAALDDAVALEPQNGPLRRYDKG